MELEKIDYMLESLLFLSGDAVSINAICDGLGYQKSEIKSSISRLKEKYAGECGIHLIEYNNKVQFTSNPEYKAEITKMLSPIREKELSSAIMETVAIIAYKQPVTKLEVELIRGVNCDYTIQSLLKYNLIAINGQKDSIGHPFTYGTTDEFLKRFRIEKIEDLPDYADLLEKIQAIESSDVQSEGLYYDYDINQESTPEFLQGEEVVKVEAGDKPEDKPESKQDTGKTDKKK